MVRVVENDALATQIVNALPERASWFGWLPRLAMTAGLAALAVTVVLRTFDDSSPTVLRSEVLSSQTVALASAALATAVLQNRTYVEPTSTERRTTVKLPENDRRTTSTDATDFEHSLPSIAAVAALELGVIAPATLPEDAPLTLAPLAIADLPLTAESSTPR
jgi:hypothetical protein